MEKMVRISDCTIHMIDVETITNSREYNDRYMIYTVDNQEYVTYQDYNDYIK